MLKYDNTIEIVMTPPRVCAGENMIGSILGVHVTPDAAKRLIKNHFAETKGLPIERQWDPESTAEFLDFAFLYWGWSRFYGLFETVDEIGAVSKDPVT